MSRFGYSRACLALGFVLGDLFEYYFFMSLKLHGPLFFLKPTCIAEMVLLIAFLGYKPMKKAFKVRIGSEKAA
jgi:TctA family transporter